MYSLLKTRLTMDNVVVNLVIDTLGQIRPTYGNEFSEIGPVVGSS